jgi:hypothetical protein
MQLALPSLDSLRRQLHRLEACYEIYTRGMAHQIANKAVLEMRKALMENPSEPLNMLLIKTLGKTIAERALQVSSGKTAGDINPASQQERQKEQRLEMAYRRLALLAVPYLRTEGKEIERLSATQYPFRFDLTRDLLTGSLPDIVQACRQRGLPTHKNKHDLILSMVDFDMKRSTMILYRLRHSYPPQLPATTCPRSLPDRVPRDVSINTRKHTNTVFQRQGTPVLVRDWHRRTNFVSATSNTR